MTPLPLLTVPQKLHRSIVITRYMAAAGYDTAVCFTCGNAADALRTEGVRVLEVGPMGELAAGQWWTPADVHNVWPDRFDATPGHLPLHLMVAIADRIRDQEPAPPGRAYRVPTGSGETILCLQLAWPQLHLVPAWDVPGLERETQFDPCAPLVGILSYHPVALT